MNNQQHRRFAAAASLGPLAATLFAVGLVITGNVTWLDVGLLVTMHVVAVIGVSVGFHRLLAHRSFTAPSWVRNTLTVAGSMAAQGPSIIWVAHHRRHHRLTDKPGDPHSPYVDQHGMHQSGWRGFWHAHMGWLLDPELESDHIRYCPDLVRERSQRWMSRHFLTLSAAGIVLPGLIGLALTQSLIGGLTGMLWGGLVRIFIMNQVTFAVNSAGHIIGRRDFATPDESRNLALLAVVSFGESWHNNHHSMPRSARFGHRWWQLDLGAGFVGLLERAHLARDVVRFDRDTIRARAQRLAASPGGRRAEAEPPPPMALAPSDTSGSPSPGQVD